MISLILGIGSAIGFLLFDYSEQSRYEEFLERKKKMEAENKTALAEGKRMPHPGSLEWR